MLLDGMQIGNRSIDVIKEFFENSHSPLFTSFTVHHCLAKNGFSQNGRALGRMVGSLEGSDDCVVEGIALGTADGATGGRPLGRVVSLEEGDDGFN